MERASVATNGAQANGPSNFGALSADGLHVAFGSQATNLPSGDSDVSPDIYLHEPGGPTTGPETVRWSLLPKFLAFGAQTVDTFRWRRFHVENLGNVPLLYSANLIGRRRGLVRAARRLPLARARSDRIATSSCFSTPCQPAIRSRSSA